MPQFLGLATVKINGAVILTAKGAKLDIGGFKRNPVIVGQVVGYAQEVMNATLDIKTAVTTGTSLTALGAVTGATVTFEADTGQTWVIADAFVTMPPTVTDGTGEVELKLAGQPAQEMM
jgi:hypothetical protein